MQELIKLLNDASKYYEQGHGDVVLSDYEYDKLFDELEALEKKTGTILPESPTQKVGYTVLSELEKVPHETPMLSLDKTKDIGALKSFLGNEQGLLSWKLDGLTIVLTYDEGKLFKAVTRGNGEIGEDITHNAMAFKNVPKEIQYNERLIIRGEAVIPYAEFEKINEALEDEEKYKNPRNLCAGTVRQLSNKATARRNVLFYAFTIVSETSFTDSKGEALKWLEGLGFSVTENVLVNISNIEETVENFKQKVINNHIATDGLVLTFDSISLSKSLGQTSKFPKDSIAFKWADETKTTKLLEIVWNTSRTGLINPVAVFQPVLLEGTTVSRASLHNVSVLEGLMLGIGDEISVYKANMIIPQVAENHTKSNTAEIPEKCPVCGYETEIVKQVEGKALYCKNSACKAQVIRGLSHFCGRDAMNVEGMSEETIEKFVENGFLNDYSDLYKLQRFENEIKSMRGFGVKSYDKLMKSVEKSRKAGLANFIYALGINQVGLRNAKLLCKHFDNDIMEIINASQEDFVNIEGFGEVIADSLYNYFNNTRNRELLLSFLPEISFKQEEKAESQSLLGKTFVITGDVNIFSNRKQLQEVIEKNGGKVTGSVTNKTNYLINNELESNSSKNVKAKALNIPIINEEQFMKLFEG